MNATYDAIVVGAGHNGLTAAALLAKQGRRVLVLEKNDQAGGLAAPHEFHPGYVSAGVLHDTSGVRDAVARSLELTRHGLRWNTAPDGLLALGDAGTGIVLSGDTETTCTAIAAHSAPDAAAYARLQRFLGRIRDALRAFVDEAPANILDIHSLRSIEMLQRALRVRRLGKHDLRALLRLLPMSVADWLDEWFATGLLKAALAQPALLGAYAGPRSPGTNANLLLEQAVAGPGVRGGGAALVEALQRAAAASGVEIRTAAAVAAIGTDRRRVTGVELEDGERVSSAIVAASCHPQHVFADLLPPGAVPSRLQHRIRNFRSRGLTAQILLAMDAPLRFAADPSTAVCRARSGGDLDAIEKAFDAAKYRRFSAAPVLDVYVPSKDQPELAPEGHSVVSILASYVPHDIDDGWNDDRRAQLVDRVVQVLDQHAPGTGQHVRASCLLTPVDLEQRYGVVGGNLYHGEHAIDQLLVRPVPECAQYATPIAGLYLCGSGTHPGGGLTCAPGAFAAAAIRRAT